MPIFTPKSFQPLQLTLSIPNQRRCSIAYPACARMPRRRRRRRRRRRKMRKMRRDVTLRDEHRLRCEAVARSFLVHPPPPPRPTPRARLLRFDTCALTVSRNAQPPPLCVLYASNSQRQSTRHRGCTDVRQQYTKNIIIIINAHPMRRRRARIETNGANDGTSHRHRRRRFRPTRRGRIVTR